jgi:hypothetical protein
MPAELADGLVRDCALPADHRRIRPEDLGSPLHGLAHRGLGRLQNR